MTHAVCVKCGSMKFGALTRCKACQHVPILEDDLVYSMVLSDHYFDKSIIDEISDQMKRGGPRPKLPKEQEDELRESMKEHFKEGSLLMLLQEAAQKGDQDEP